MLDPVGALRGEPLLSRGAEAQRVGAERSLGRGPRPEVLDLRQLEVERGPVLEADTEALPEARREDADVEPPAHGASAGGCAVGDHSRKRYTPLSSFTRKPSRS